jgi:hypothetical protein
VDAVRVIRDRATGVSKRYAFVEFRSIAEAKKVCARARCARLVASAAHAVRARARAHAHAVV